MGLWDRLKGVLAGGGGGSDVSDRDGLYFYVRCARCGDVVRVRVSLANELFQEFSEDGGIAGYTLRKGIVDTRCFRPIQVTMTFDSSRRERSREIDGGEFISEDAYVAARQPSSAADGP